MTDLSTDVIVIGGGAGGLCAALAARQEGADVLLISKTPVGLACSTAFSGGGFALAVEGMTVEEHYQIAVKIGRNLNEHRLIDILSREAPAYVLQLRNFGVEFDYTPGEVSVQPYARSPIMAGTGLTLPLIKQLKHKGIRTQTGVIATELFSDERGIGVEVVHWLNPKISVYRAGAIVIATGGAGALYGHTDNPRRTTGDGYSLLHRAGADLQDMEFVQFLPLGFAEHSHLAWAIDLKIIDQVPLTNSNGDSFLENELKKLKLDKASEASQYDRNRITVNIARELNEGKEIYLHLNELSASQWQHSDYAQIRRFYSPSFDPRRSPLGVGPSAHFLCGGVTISHDGETGLPGIYACGETTGGVHGADRLPGNALSEAVVFGFRTGKVAAIYALRRPCKYTNAGPSGTTQIKLRRWSNNIGGDLPRDLRKRLNKIADQRLGPIRRRTDLETALCELDELEQMLPRLRLERRRDLLEALEFENLCLAARMIAQAALLRTESRGVHFRDDYPNEDNSWTRHIKLFQGEDGITFEVR